ncbi:hypothetical protein ACQKLP_10915 [Chitinophaga sp. NPDC101104]|uniref:hypothetical protein n=1 Tax=Chitinophaga sp. NPDC101104 TaxID=3390561 RepID=UPI003CFD3AA1
MKKIILAAFLLATAFLSISTKAQVSFTFRELFKQNKTEIKYLSQQVGELQLYLSAVKKGYQVVESGLRTVNAIKKGEYSIHDIFYAGQFLVSTAIKSMPAVTATIDNSRRIHRNTRNFLRELNTTDQFSNSQKEYIVRTCGHLLADVDNNISQLQRLLTSGALQMDDHQRIEAIQKIYQQSTDQLQFASQFITDAKLIGISRKQSLLDLQVLRNRYNLQNPLP